MTDAMLKNQIENDPLFVNAKRFENNIEKLEARYPDSAPDHVISAALMIPENEVQPSYDLIVVKMRNLMGVVL